MCGRDAAESLAGSLVSSVATWSSRSGSCTDRSVPLGWPGSRTTSARGEHAETVGIPLCGSRNDRVVGYSLGAIAAPLAVATYDALHTRRLRRHRSRTVSPRITRGSLVASLVRSARLPLTVSVKVSSTVPIAAT